MTTSGTYNFAPSNAQIIREALDRCGIRPAEITNEHMVSAQFSMNLELQDWANRGLNLWLQTQATIALVSGTATYALPATLVELLDVWYTLPGTTGQGTTDRLLLPLGRSDWAALPTKQLQGTPTSYWFDKLMAPTITFWLVPSQAATVNFFYLPQLQDAAVAMNQTPQIPNRFLEPAIAGVAVRCAKKWAPARVMELMADAKAAWAAAAASDRETVDIHITPDLARYWQM